MEFAIICNAATLLHARAAAIVQVLSMAQHDVIEVERETAIW